MAQSIKLAGPDGNQIFKVISTKNTKLLYPGDLVTLRCYEIHLLQLTKRKIDKVEVNVVEPMSRDFQQEGGVNTGRFPTINKRMFLTLDDYTIEVYADEQAYEATIFEKHRRK